MLVGVCLTKVYVCEGHNDDGLFDKIPASNTSKSREKRELMDELERDFGWLLASVGMDPLNSDLPQF